MKLLFATSNPNKVREVNEILGAGGVVLSDLSCLSDVPPEPPEDEPTFEGNAETKALAYAKATGCVCLAEDSGLEVDALGGKPGVHSARYSGQGGTRPERDRANNKKLLLELRGTPESDRAARFVCAMCVATPEGDILATARGSFEGQIALQPAGQNGFGYDPLLYLPELRCTSAQLSSEEKHQRSHRGEATRKLAELLKRLGE